MSADAEQEQPRLSEVQIRPARPADADVLTELIRSAYRGQDSRAGWTSEADLVEGERISRDQVLAMISAGALLLVGLLVGEGAGQIVACCQLRNEGAGGWPTSARSRSRPRPRARAWAASSWPKPNARPWPRSQPRAWR